MSDFYVNLIPEDPGYKLTREQINEIQGLSWCSGNVSIHINDTVQFADAGSNFESV